MNDTSATISRNTSMEKSSLLDDLSNATPVSAKQCGIAKARQSMTNEESIALEQAFDKIRQKNSSPSSIQTSGYTYKWLTDVLKKNGFDVSLRVVEKHSRRMCGCHGA